MVPADLKGLQVRAVPFSVLRQDDFLARLALISKLEMSTAGSNDGAQIVNAWPCI